MAMLTLSVLFNNKPRPANVQLVCAHCGGKLRTEEGICWVPLNPHSDPMGQGLCVLLCLECDQELGPSLVDHSE